MARGVLREGRWLVTWKLRSAESGKQQAAFMVGSAPRRVGANAEHPAVIVAGALVKGNRRLITTGGGLTLCSSCMN